MISRSVTKVRGIMLIMSAQGTINAQTERGAKEMTKNVVFTIILMSIIVGLLTSK